MRYCYLFLVGFLLMSACAWGQQEDDHTKTEFTYVDQMPKPSVDLGQYLSQYLTYPEDARRASIEGKVILKFVVNENGGIQDIMVIKSVSPSVDSEAIRVLMSMPPWKPGKQNGQAVKVYFTLPINFKLTEK